MLSLFRFIAIWLVHLHALKPILSYGNITFDIRLLFQGQLGRKTTLMYFSFVFVLMVRTITCSSYILEAGENENERR